LCCCPGKKRQGPGSRNGPVFLWRERQDRGRVSHSFSIKGKRTHLGGGKGKRGIFLIARYEKKGGVTLINPGILPRKRGSCVLLGFQKKRGLGTSDRQPPVRNAKTESRFKVGPYRHRVFRLLSWERGAKEKRIKGEGGKKRTKAEIQKAPEISSSISLRKEHGVRTATRNIVEPGGREREGTAVVVGGGWGGKRLGWRGKRQRRRSEKEKGR